jgi:hypothetical protein
MRDRVVAQRNQFVSTARQHQKQRQREGDENQPTQYLDATRKGRQHETSRHRNHVDDCLMLGPQRIEKLERRLQYCYPKERWAQCDAQHRSQVRRVLRQNGSRQQR